MVDEIGDVMQELAEQLNEMIKKHGAIKLLTVFEELAYIRSDHFINTEVDPNLKWRWRQLAQRLGRVKIFAVDSKL
jgi:hypothetical protein